MLRINASGASYCIDHTEVTNAEYAQFLANVTTFDRTKLPPICASHGPFVPLGDDGGPTFPDASGLDDYAVGNVDVCEAYAFCAWAGKRLCGRIGGGPNPTTDSTNPTASQWFQACSLGGNLFYPYGNVYDGGTCNTSDQPTVGPVPVGSLGGCQGGYAGLFDMSGNIEEIEDSCDDAGNCNARGGSYANNPGAAETRCDFVQTLVFDEHHPDVGFRCCGP